MAVMRRELVAVKCGRGRAMQTHTGSTVAIRHGRHTWQIAIYSRGAMVARRPPAGWGFAFRRLEAAPRWRPGVTPWRAPRAALVLTLTIPRDAEVTLQPHEPHGRTRR